MSTFANDEDKPHIHSNFGSTNISVNDATKVGSFEALEKSGDGHEQFNVKALDGEPIIETGLDVSRFVVDLRDDGDPAMTFRSFVLGTMLAGLGAALVQISMFKPVGIGLSTVFLTFLFYSVGNAWAKCLPKRSWVENTRFEFLGPILHFINPGPFGLKEHVVAVLIASTGASSSSAVNIFAVQRLYYNLNVKATTAVLATFSTACFGYGLVGLLRPLTVYPSEMVYWGSLPTISIFQAIHFVKDRSSVNRKRLKLFWIAFFAMFCYEVLPAYMFPLLNGINIVCLTTQHASPKTLDFITNLFGGADSNEGMGLLSLSFDWQYIGSGTMSLPLVQQANTWIGYGLSYIILLAIFYSNAWNAKHFPFMSLSLFSQNGSIYHQNAIFGPNFHLNKTALQEVGLPALTGSNVWYSLTQNLSIGGLIAHTLLFWGPYIKETLKLARDKSEPDPHYQAMKKYKEAPWWWYTILLVVSFFAGLIVVLKGETTLPWWSYIIALLLGVFITPFSTLLNARLGSGVSTVQLMKMVAGVVNPGRPVANLYFSMWSHDVIATSLWLANDLKLGQYMTIPPRVMFFVQIWGTILGAVVNYVVMVKVVDSRREILLDPRGNNIWTGQWIQSINSSAVTWSIAKELYGPGGPYFIIPMSFLIGMVPTVIQWLIWRKYPTIGPLKLNSVVLPLIYMYSAYLGWGVNSSLLSYITVGILSQVWLRKYHPAWYRKYNYILGGALDGGSQVMIFVLTFAVFGASGKGHPFPHWAGNPAKGNIDYCNGNGALDY